MTGSNRSPNKLAILFIDTLIRLSIDNPDREWIDEIEISENFPVPPGRSYNTAYIKDRDQWKRHISAIQRIAAQHDYQAIIENRVKKITGGTIPFRMRRYRNGNLILDEIVKPTDRLIKSYRIANKNQVLKAYNKRLDLYKSMKGGYNES